jgi:hypothetical protein
MDQYSSVKDGYLMSALEVIKYSKYSAFRNIAILIGMIFGTLQLLAVIVNV